MFTGLIQQLGRMEHISFQGDAGRLTLSVPVETSLQIGESIAINGTCLTLVQQSGPHLVFDVLQETFSKTSLRDKSAGALLHIERALRIGDPIGGHLVSGHVDGTGELLRVETVGRDKVLTISAPDLISEVVPKGSIALDGVSLTVVNVTPSDGCFTVHIIPHTWRETTFATLSLGSRINLETDMIGKYVRAAITTPSEHSTLTWEALRNAGFLA